MRPLLSLLLAALVGLPCSGAAQDAVELAKAGVPALSRPWTGADYRQLADAIVEGRVPLPRLSDPAGAAIFRRVVDPENVEGSRSAALGIQSRMGLFANVMGGLPPLLNAYLSPAAAKGPVPHEELARLMAYMLDLAGLGVDLLDEFLPTLPRDESYPTRMEGLRRMRAGLTQVVMGGEVSLGEALYADADRTIMLSALASNLPRLQTALALDVVVDLRGKLERHRPRFQGEDRARLEGMIKLLADREKAQPKAAAEKGPTEPAKP